MNTYFWFCNDHVKALWHRVIEKRSLAKFRNAEWKDIHVGRVVKGQQGNLVQ